VITRAKQGKGRAEVQEFVDRHKGPLMDRHKRATKRVCPEEGLLKPPEISRIDMADPEVVAIHVASRSKTAAIGQVVVGDMVSQRPPRLPAGWTATQASEDRCTDLGSSDTTCLSVVVGEI